MTFPAKVTKLIEEFNKNAENPGNYAFFESEDGDFFGVGYASPAKMCEDVNKHLLALNGTLAVEDMVLPDDVRKCWGVSVDTRIEDELYIITNKVTERTPHAFPLYAIYS